MPRVLLLFNPPDGGVAEHVRQLALGLAAEGFDVEVAGPAKALPYPAIAAAGITIHRLPLEVGWRHPFHDVAAFAKLVWLLHRGAYDLVHSHGAKAGMISRPAGRITRIPAVHTAHGIGSYLNEPSNGRPGGVRAAKGIVLRTLEQALRSMTSALICVSEHDREAIVARRPTPLRRIYRVYNAAEPCDSHIATDSALAEARSRGLVFGVVAALREQKRVDVFIRAVPLVLQRFPSATAAVVGNGTLESELRTLAAKLGLDSDERFLFLPFEPPSARHLRELDLFVLSSRDEGLPIGVLEAMACSVPQVVTAVGGSGEAVSADTGILVPPFDPPALADAIVALLEDDERRNAMADASRQRYNQWFRPERMVGETAQVYATVLSRGHASSAPR